MDCDRSEGREDWSCVCLAGGTLDVARRMEPGQERSGAELSAREQMSSDTVAAARNILSLSLSLSAISDLVEWATVGPHSSDPPSSSSSVLWSLADCVSPRDGAFVFVAGVSPSFFLEKTLWYDIGGRWHVNGEQMQVELESWLVVVWNSSFRPMILRSRGCPRATDGQFENWVISSEFFAFLWMKI